MDLWRVLGGVVALVGVAVAGAACGGAPFTQSEALTSPTADVDASRDANADSAASSHDAEPDVAEAPDGGMDGASNDAPDGDGYACTPRTCESINKCGSFSDGCGQLLECQCGWMQTCIMGVCK